jgi:fructose-bisphosphate aldolase class 1
MSPHTSSSQRLTQLLLAILAVGVWGVLLRLNLPIAAAAAKPSSATPTASFDTITVQRINVADADGTTRLVIANSARLPGAIIHGKEYPRSIKDAAGVLFLDTKGEETGGLALSQLRDNNVATLTFDYTHQLTDGIRIWKQESVDGAKWRAAFDIFDRRPYTGAVESSQGVQRIALADENQKAELVISDPEGRPRIRIGVDKGGEPSIVMLSPEGKVIYRAAK